MFPRLAIPCPVAPLVTYCFDAMLRVSAKEDIRSIFCFRICSISEPFWLAFAFLDFHFSCHDSKIRRVERVKGKVNTGSPVFFITPDSIFCMKTVVMVLIVPASTEVLDKGKITQDKMAMERRGLYPHSPA